MDELMQQVPPSDQLNPSKRGSLNLLPNQSKEKYMSIYQKFISWRRKKKSSSFSEDELMTYFNELALTLKPSSLWAHYSMLKSTLSIYHNINIKTYTVLLSFLKKQNTGFKSKKSKVLTAEEVERFLDEAPDQQYLATKVGLIFGINGACRRDELCSIRVYDVKEYDNSMILVKLPRTKVHIERSFTVTGKFYTVVKRYMALRPKNSKNDRFFLNYQSGKCTQQPIGINKFGNMPKIIATFLGLPEADHYTGHSFRRTSATLLADAGSDIATLKRHRRWKTNQVLEDSLGLYGSKRRRSMFNAEHEDDGEGSCIQHDNTDYGLQQDSTTESSELKVNDTDLGVVQIKSEKPDQFATIIVKDEESRTEGENANGRQPQEETEPTDEPEFIYIKTEPCSPPRHPEKAALPVVPSSSSTSSSSRCDSCSATCSAQTNDGIQKTTTPPRSGICKVGIPLINLETPGIMQQWANLGIRNYIPVPVSGAGGNFVMPVISTCNAGIVNAIPATTMISLESIRTLPEPQ